MKFHLNRTNILLLYKGSSRSVQNQGGGWIKFS